MSTSSPQLRVAIDVGCHQHHVVIGNSDGRCLDELDIGHTRQGFRHFFRRIDKCLEQSGDIPVAVAMEGCNGWARPLDSQILSKGYRLFNVNNVKLARFKEIFPGAAKNDRVDGHKILEIFQLQDHLPLAKRVLQEVPPQSPVHRQLKRLSRRRRQLVDEKVKLVNRLQTDLQAVCPGLLAITGDADNLWFLRFLTSRNDLTQLARLQEKSLLKISSIGKLYAAKIQAWQHQALFGDEVEWVSPMIIADAKRILVLREDIARLEHQIDRCAEASPMARHIRSIPGFGVVTEGELTAEIGAIERFASEASLALYLGMTQLDNSSGSSRGTKPSKQVNRRAKAAMMTALARHMHVVPQSRRYYEKKRREGKTHNQAIRALGRHLVRVIFAMLTQDRDYEIHSP